MIFLCIFRCKSRECNVTASTKIHYLWWQVRVLVLWHGQHFNYCHSVSILLRYYRNLVIISEYPHTGVWSMRNIVSTNALFIKYWTRTPTHYVCPYVQILAVVCLKQYCKLWCSSGFGTCHGVCRGHNVERFHRYSPYGLRVSVSSHVKTTAENQKEAGYCMTKCRI